ncbi:hypothetical protein SAMN02799620_00779, partial [Mycolicibacterium fluoranthenivorans]
MSNSLHKPVKKVATRCAIAVTATALIAGSAGQFASPVSLPAVRHASYDIVNTAAVDEQAATVGIAESYLYYEVANATTTAERQSLINKALDALQSVGASDVRIGIPWNAVETADGKYNWSVTD